MITETPSESSSSRFSCTQCGKCCNRSPEVELSEATALADTFVFRLMFRVYWLPQQFITPQGAEKAPLNSSSAFYERKRLLTAFAAHKASLKAKRDHKSVASTRYLMMSALALDTKSGECGALHGTRCSIHERRPLSCRSVPLHYSRTSATADIDLKAFVETDGYRCDTSQASPIILHNGLIVDDEINTARSNAITTAKRDRPWSEAIARRVVSRPSANRRLPTMEDIEANSQYGALTVSMFEAWQIATDTGLIDLVEFKRLANAQLDRIDFSLLHGTSSMDTQQTMIEMQNEYRNFIRLS